MCICHIVSEYKNNLFLSQIKVLFENSVHLSHSFRIESGSRLITASTAAPPCGASLLIISPRTLSGGTESGSALRTSSSTLSSASPVVAHLRRALCGSHPATPCVLAPLIRMGLLKIARLQRADIASPSPLAIPTQHQRRAYGASETRYCIITPFARRDSGGRMGHRRSTIARRFGDALLLQRRSMTARAVTSSVNPTASGACARR